MLSEFLGADLIAQLTPPRVYVHLALLFYVLGFLTRDELILRAQVLAGTLFYILYYYFISDLPLWEAIWGSLAIAAANIYSSYIIIYERSTFGMTTSERALFANFHTLRPGHFRRIMKKATRWRVEKDTELLTRDVAVDKLYFVHSGEVEIRRGAKVATLEQGHFLGELAFLKGTPASATVTAKPGAEVIMWDQATLKTIMDKSPTISNAILALFNEDLATKLLASWPEDKVVKTA
ncbi:MAG: cyclic nucleotide-binding domain-containing protein [Pseudomonadota bacterium]